MKTHPGFTLIEVLIAMTLLAGGLLGMAALQATALKYNLSAHHRSQATQLAYELADRMRANTAGRATYTAIVPTDATAKANCLTTTGCTVADMAENDLFQWNATVTRVLPSGVGTIALTGSIYTITVTWDDDRDGNAANNPSFQTSFQL